MKHFTLTMTAAALLMLPAAYPQQAALGRTAAAPRPVSPEIHADRTVTFRLFAPKANEVTLNGSWEGARDIKMSKDDGGIWSVSVGPLGAQLWGYWYLVDGVKALDPGNGETQRDGSRIDNLLMISGPESDLWDYAYRLVPVTHVETGSPPHVHLYAARVRGQPDPLPRPIPAARRRWR
jgi:enterochelin esterase family protein